MSTKKAFVPIVELLQANKDKKVSAVLDEVIALTEAKTGGGGRASSNVIRNDKGEVTHVFCYYHKKWEDVSEVEFGKKASSATGLNSMCKEGTAAWTKQQRESKNAKDELLKKVGAGEVNPKEIEKEMAKIEKARAKIVPREDGKGSDEPPGGKKEAEAA